ncbi:putative serine threonine protein kinase protein [Rosellinia necatrix]|uniref:Putative serine threonine protein kinase protein n=1 Tax=Rosellinia necatrix TaxID=77044 RepID=A0A1W2TRN3_ROSNE|nr:putative serine threonine protein kinase protein [Rosellinia necatrix]
MIRGSAIFRTTPPSSTDSSGLAPVREFTEELANYFAKSEIWKVEKLLGSGSFGIVVLLREKNTRPLTRPRRVVLKVPIRPDRGGRELLGEIAALKQMRGCAHIAQMLTSCDDVSMAIQLSPLERSAPELVQRLRVWMRPSLDTVFDTMRKSALEGPAMLLEYLENGSLLTIMIKAGERRVRLPNRLMWSFHLCLVRACVGLAFPPNGPRNSTPTMETIEEDREPSRFRHNDVAFRNIMIGDRDPAGPPEHHMMAPLKLIDFGIMDEARSSKEAIGDNVWAISECMAEVITWNRNTAPYGLPVVHNGIVTAASHLLPRLGVNMLPDLDDELRDLVAQGMARNPDDRPTLPELLHRASQGMRKPAASYPGRELEESDERIAAILDDLIFNA